MITLAKDGSLAARRQALGYMYDKQRSCSVEQVLTGMAIAQAVIPCAANRAPPGR